MRDFVVQALKKLVSIPSVNPTFAGPRSGPGGEAAIIEYLEWQCESFGLATELIPTPSADRPSLIARLPGSGGGRSLMLNGHVDTVGVETVDEPFEPRVSDGRLYGRGAYDMKGGVAACLAALLELSRRPHPPRGDVWFTAVADEEDASEGARAVARRLSTDGVIVTEPTHLVPTVAHKGFAWVEVRTQGFACHGSRDDRGIDANRRAATVFAALDALETERSSLRHPLLGSPSLHVGRIEGGVGPSVYSPSCRLTVELRTLPDESTDLLVSRLAELIEEVAPESSVIASPPEVTLARPPLDGSADGTLASMVADAVERTTGERPSAAGVGYWTDAAVFAETSREVLLLGPSGDGAHEDVEWVDLDSVVANARILVDVVKAYCG